MVEGEPVELGELSFNVIFSRYLNPNDNEDAAYLVGQKPPPEGSTYFGVFFEVQNESDEPQTLPSTLTITDADKNDLRRARRAKASTRSSSAAKSNPRNRSRCSTRPPQQGPIEGSLALFLLPDEASDNRPLTLHIPGADGETGEVTLDL